MRFPTLPAALMVLTALMTGPAAAQGQRWSGTTLIVTGQTTNGCDIDVPLAQHIGSLRGTSIIINFTNRGPRAVRVSSVAELLRRDGNTSGRVNDALLPPGATASVAAFPPGGHTLEGTVLRVSITQCPLWVQ